MRHILVYACVSFAISCSSLPTAELNQEDNNGVAECCKKLFPPGPSRGQCISDGAHGKGPCAQGDSADLSTPLI